MAAITTAGSGNWTSTTPNAPWPGGTVPTSADTVTIAKNHTVTLNATTCAATSVTMALGTTGGDAGGVLTASLTASSKLTLGQGITAPGSATVAYSTYLNFDMRSANAGVICELVVNNVNATGAGHGITTGGAWNMRGQVRTRWSTINSALVANTTMSVVIADCTGWAVGDKLVFATTSAYNAVPKTDEVTIATITPGVGTTATVTWTDGTGTGGAVANAHASGCPVGNFTSNLVIRPGTNGNVAFFHANGGTASSSVAQHFTDVESRFCKTSSTLGAAPCGMNTSSSQLTSVSNNAFWGWDGTAMYLRSLSKPVTRQRNIFYSAVSFASCLLGQDVSGNAEIGPDEEYAIFRSSIGVVALFASQNQNGHQISGTSAAGNAANGSILFSGRASTQANNCRIWSCNSGIANNSVSFANGCTFGSAVFAGCDNSNSTFYQGPGTLTLKDCVSPANLGIIGMTVAQPNSRVVVTNKNANPAIQEVYGSHSLTVPIIQRDTSLASTGRSTSALLMTLNATTAVPQSFEVLTKAGQTIDILCLVRKSGTPAYGASTLPQVTISGLGITPVTATMSSGTAADTWETLSISATNSGSADGNLTVTFTAQSSVAGAKAWFSGVPISPFVSRCRHYGYLFDEASPTRTVNITASANEATAATYTGAVVTWNTGTTPSPTTLTASRSFQYVYDETQYEACLNVGANLPLVGTGVAGSPALFAQGNITTTGFVLNGEGSLSMGSYTLTASLPWSYTYTGGTFSQATGSGVPSFSGGSLAIGDGGTYTFKTTADTLVVVTPSAATSYTFTSGTFTGTLTLNNTTATPVTVFVPAGTATSSAGNTGGAITFSAPIIQQSVTINGVVPGSRVQIYDTTNSVELFNGTYGYAWTDSAAAVGDRAIRVRIAYQSGGTAKTFVEANIGTCGTTTVAAAVSYLASQVDDTVYNTNGIDGSTVSGITISDSIDRMLINIGGGSVSWKSIYAYNVHWLTTAAGIIDDGAIITAPDTANYIVIGFKIRNTSAMPLVITGGYGRDSVTDTVAACIDTADSTGNIFPAPDHVIPYSVGSGLSAGEQAQLASAANAGNIVVSGGFVAADIKAVNGAAITGAGTPVSPWGP